MKKVCATCRYAIVSKVAKGRLDLLCTSVHHDKGIVSPKFHCKVWRMAK
jgi:hypothetical protein